MFLATIHDCLMVLPGDAYYARSVMIEEFAGLGLKLSVEVKPVSESSGVPVSFCEPVGKTVLGITGWGVQYLVVDALDFGDTSMKKSARPIRKPALKQRSSSKTSRKNSKTKPVSESRVCRDAATGPADSRHVREGG